MQPLTLLLGALAAAIYLLPGAAELLAWDRAAVAAGEWWRVLGSHWVHWSQGHLVWDLGAFVILGSVCERRGATRFVAYVCLAALAIPLALWWLCPELQRYGGLSGLESGLFVLLVGELLAEALHARRLVSAVASLALLLGFAGKVAFEVATGGALFVSDLGPGVVPVPWAHLVGALAGLVSLMLIRPPADRYAAGRGRVRAACAAP